MSWFRRLLHRPHAAACLLAVALLMKLMVPAGFMPVADHGSVTLMPCSGFGPQPMAMKAGHGGHGDHGQQNHHQGEQKTPCDFSVLAGPALAGGDSIALAEPVGFAALKAELPPTIVARAAPAHLRPPLRGPPAI